MSETVKVKEYTIELTITEEQKALLERAVSLKRISLKAYTLLNVLAVAKEEIESYEVLVLSDCDRDMFLSGMENPPQLCGKLKEAIADYQEQYGNEAIDDRKWKQSEIDAVLAEMVSDPEYQAEVLHLEDEFATAQWEALQLAEFPEL